MNWIVRWLCKWLMGGFTAVVSLISEVTKNCFDNSVIISILSVFKTIGLPLTAFAILVLLLKTLLSASDGESVNVIDIGKRCIFGIAIYSYGVFILQKFYLVILDICQKLLNIIVNATDVEWNWEAAGLDVAGLVPLVLIVIMIYYLFKTFMNLTERFWQLLVILCMLYIYLPSYIAGDDESIVLWFKQTIAIILTQVFQTVLITTGLSIFISTSSIGDFFMTLGALVAASKVEQLMDRYGMGVGGKLGGLARNSMSVAFYAKSIFRK